MVDIAQTIRLGTLTVQRLGFGTMQLTGPGVWGPPRDHDTAVAVLRKAVELGVEMIDTADAYGPFVAEELIHEALYPYPDSLRIATKAGLTRPGPSEWVACGRPDYLRRQCDSSLLRLGVERIDLFQLHRIDKHVPADEQFGVLKELRDEGKVMEVGLSEVSVKQIKAAERIVPIVSVQNLYNIGERKSDDIVDYCNMQQIGFIPWFPLANGKLSRPGSPIDDVAKQLGATIPQVALAWLLRRSPIMLPIPGTSSLDHLAENCDAVRIDLSDPQFKKLTDAHKPLRRWTQAS